jgi:Mrr restriction endonuclease-like protein
MSTGFLWVLNDEGGAADLGTIYQRVHSALRLQMDPKLDEAPREKSGGHPKWKDQIRFALQNMKESGGDARVRLVRRERWEITDAGRQWLKENPSPPEWRQTIV